MTAAASTAVDTEELRKARGAFFTPEPIARYVTKWAVRSTADRVLEPSCGEAAFLLAAVDHLTRLGAADPSPAAVGALDGVELHPESAAAAESMLRRAGVTARVVAEDFFCIAPTGSYDVVIGNPPYVRYQDFVGEARARSRAAALRAGVSLTNLASSWAAFTVHSALFLKRGGRMGLVLPAELMSVNYAAEVRTFLLREFARVDLVVFNERVFPGVLEEVVLLLADGYQEGPAGHARISEAQNAADLEGAAHVSRKWTPDRPGDKWTASLVPAAALEVYSMLIGDGAAFTRLETWGDTTLGMVTGNNKFFTLSPARVDQLGLTNSDALRVSPPGSRHLRGLSLTAARWHDLGSRGEATWLFRPTGVPSSAGRAYIGMGEAAGVPDAYKCRIRQPWWQVPLVPPADLLVTYMNADTPRLCTNRAGVRHLNSVHGVYLRDEYRALGRELLSLASLNTLTLLGAETVGRSYGGGMLKLEPREADQLPMPAPSLVADNAAALAAVRPAVREALAGGRLLNAVCLVDEVLLGRALNIADDARAALVDARARMAARRVARSADAVQQTASDR